MWFTILEDENCKENENGKIEKEKIENVGRARERGNTGFYVKSYWEFCYIARAK